MKTTNTQLKAVFKNLNERIEKINRTRREDGLIPLAKAEVKLLGQMSLLANEKASLLLSLAQTADMDALLTMNHLLKDELKKLLKKQGLVYDEDSHLIWIPEGAKFEDLFNFSNVNVFAIDPESALVSKAVKAPKKNKQLIRQAIALGKFPGLIDRIETNGGSLEFFAED